jgi:hypothetical protein
MRTQNKGDLKGGNMKTRAVVVTLELRSDQSVSNIKAGMRLLIEDGFEGTKVEQVQVNIVQDKKV